ncbi:hypothetical protein KY290_021683 [Solanum tuberosum]|uniref:Integrase core domain containing protein n=1 Tax=Solanum tuberosum TaxID=4113 RepID=A0ABQ7V297_SOLTU|nr:hypothetical protein KY290_021683 [Solanum tuberosum]
MNRPRGQVLQGGPRGRLGPMSFDRRYHDNHPQGGDQWEAMSIKKLVKKLEKDMVTAIKEDVKGVTTTMTKVDAIWILSRPFTRSQTQDLQMMQGLFMKMEVIEMILMANKGF